MKIKVVMTKFIQGVIGYVKSFWACLINVGVTDSVSADDVRYIRFANVVAVLTSIAIISYIPGSLLHKDFMITGLQLANLFCVLSVLWLNRLGYHGVARQTYLAVVNISVLLNASIIGFQSGVQDFFYFTYLLPFLLFRVKDYKNILTGIIMAITAYNIFQLVHPYFTIYNLSLTDQMAVHSVNIWM